MINYNEIKLIRERLIKEGKREGKDFEIIIRSPGESDEEENKKLMLCKFISEELVDIGNIGRKA